MAPITHIVMFQPKTGPSEEATKTMIDEMCGLKDNCVHPTTKKPYIKSLIGGKDNSPEGMQDGITTIFVVEFESDEDRDYYVNSDPVHRSFVEKNASNFEKAQVVDFTPGTF